jgi:uncharacterized protein YyaL (SSP411 family)
MPDTDRAVGTTPNALIHEKSPYLLQHAYNPVNWYPWGEEALRRAKEEDKPIFLSIGYATCHWCHVMARESFENPQTAAILNEHFVSIKVDREERPELDALYMKAVQLIAGTGGWPLSVFLTPALKPFYGGTYFPPEPRHGLPAFTELLETLSSFWHERRTQLETNAEQVVQLVRTMYEQPRRAAAEELTEDLLENAYEQLVLQFDATHAPKFPLPSFIAFLLRYYHRTREPSAVKMVTKTLDAMARGGIFDQLGGGFHRYATDQRWLVPHFEKMLYDNALLARAYTEAYQVTGERFFAEIANRTLDWVLREMTDRTGGFYSALDADSEGREGAFYLWAPAEITAVLGDADGEVLSRYFGVTSEGNFEGGTSVLSLASPAANVDAAMIRRALQQLLAARNQRVRPATDDKILTSWNGLMISACALGYQVFRDHRYRAAAIKATAFILEQLRRDGLLLHRYRDGEASIPGTLSDYAFFTAALLDLYEATFESHWLREAFVLNERMLELFWDTESGGLFETTVQERKELGVAIKEAYDGPIPSGNSVAAQNFLRLAALSEDADLRGRAGAIFRVFHESLEADPLEHAQMLGALNFSLSAPYHVVLVSDRLEEVEPFATELGQHFLPTKVAVFSQPGVTVNELPALKPLLAEKVAIQERPTVYLCENYTCKEPITKVDELKRVLSSRTPP